MDSKEAMKKACEDVSVAKVAECLKLSKTALYNQMNDPDRQDILQKFIEFNAACENDISLGWVCEECNGVFVKNPDTEKIKQQISDNCIPDSLQEFSDVIREISKAMKDGNVSREEVKIIRKEWEEVKIILETAILSWECLS